MTNAKSNGQQIHGPHHLSNRLSIFAKGVVQEKTKESQILNQAAEQLIPKFLESELEIGHVLGRGGFCVVNEITKVTLKGTKTIEDGDYDDGDVMTSKVIIQDRGYMATHFRRQSKDCRYAIKRLHDDTRKDETNFVNGVIDLALEARFLSILCHPHIITLRGMAIATPYDGEFFLILDRLYDTLTTRLTKWKRQNAGGLKKLMDRSGKKKQAFYVERCTVAHDLACALKYMHSLNVMYRDVKPDNVGFDVRGDAMFFDFDLAKEFDPTKRSKDGTYKLTEDTGTVFYMAPEVSLGKPYNESVDVYSFSIMLWQILKVEQPFEGYNVNMFKKNVVRGGVRPRCDPSWPQELSDMMKNGWHSDLHKRPMMDDVVACLCKEISRNEGEKIPVGMKQRKSELSLAELEASAHCD